MTDIPLLVSVPGDRHAAGRSEPVTGGVPLPRGLARDEDAWALVTADGTILPTQTTPTDHWPDGSIRWLLVDSQVSTQLDAVLPLSLRLAGGRAHGMCRVQDTPTGLSIDTGSSVFLLSTSAPAVVASVTGRNGQIYDGAASDVRIVGADGEKWRVTWHKVTVELAGSMRVATVAEGVGTGRAGRTLALFLRLEFFSGLATVRLRLTVRNPERAEHPGGTWELGDVGSVLLRELSLILPGTAASDTHLELFAEPGQHVVAWQRVHVHQESSGGENWSSPNHLTRSGAVTLRFRVYETTADGATARSLRATPTVLIASAAASLSVAVPQFWQNFPRSIEATSSALRVSFFPFESAEPHELQGGEQKTHECYLSFASDTITDVPLDWCHARAVLHATPEWNAASAAISNLVAAREEEAAYRALVNAAIDGGDTFTHKREVADEYGWRHFGDLYGDHEAVRHTGPAPLMSHYNNQYDPIAGFLYQFARTGDTRWWRQCVELAAHVVDIDVYHTNLDKSAYNHGLFWHTIHYINAGKSTHRSYPSGTAGGGPSSEQNYTTGLMLYFYVTGDRLARDTALGLSRFVIDMDDGSKTVFRYLDHGYTGVATASRSTDYHGPGRGSGNSLNALVDGHRLTGDRVFLDKAEQIIRRCTHPRQDIERLTLLDPENRWFYTMYLQSLGKYLQWKADRDELDAMYAYGRGVLLHFSRWMADHERPYLTRPDLLEFPTETWAAQDIRKSEVFDHAARHASGAEVARFSERAEFFFRYSIDTLTTRPTRTLARPVVLMLVHGLLRAHTRTHGVTPAPEPREDWTPQWLLQEPFVPQKARAKRRLTRMAVAAFITALSAIFLYWIVM